MNHGNISLENFEQKREIILLIFNLVYLSLQSREQTGEDKNGHD
jgi:hypothetical protein